MKLKHSINALTLLALIGTGTAGADGNAPQGGDMTLFLSNVSSLPTYNAGYFVNDDIMPYGSLAVSNDDNDSGFSLGGGARFYGLPQMSEDIRTYVNGSLRYTSDGFRGGNAALATLGSFGGSGSGGTDVVTLGGHFGAELQLAPSATLGAQVGMDITDTDNNTLIQVGTADLLLNYYF